MLEAKHIVFCYPSSDQPILNDISFEVREGAFTAILGANGSGKSTLARILAGSMPPTAGEVLVDGAPLERGWPHVGFVRQDPQDQLVSENVSEEIAFGLQGLGLNEEEQSQRVRSMLEQCGIAYAKDVPTAELSGGEQQRLALAGVLAFGPSYLVLDEPTSYLDVTSRERFIRIVESLATQERGIVLVTHRLEEALAAQRVVVMDHGSIAWEGSSQEFAQDVDAQRLARLDLYEAPRASEEKTVPSGYENPCLQLSHISVELGDYMAVRDVSFSSSAGTVTLFTGRSGSGKTTCAHTIAGLLTPVEGSVTCQGKNVCVGDVGLSVQHPEDQLFCDTVFEDVMYGPRNRGMNQEEAAACARQSLELLGVSEELWDRHPQFLSGGERRRVALAGIVALDVETYMFDEPTAGLDGDGRRAMRAVARELARRGKTVLVISHDVDEWLSVADYLVIMAQGSLTYVGPTSCALDSAEPFLQAELIPPRAMLEALEKEGGQGKDLVEEVLSLDVVEPRPSRVTLMQRVPAGVQIVLLLVLTFALFATNSLAVAASALVLAAIACGFAHVRLRDAANLMGAVSVVLLFALVSNTVILDGTGEIPLAGPLGLSSKGALRALLSITRIIAMALMALAISRSTTASGVSKAIISPLRPLSKLHLSIDRLSTTVMLALRCLPQAMEEFKNVESAQLVRKAPLRTGKIRARLATWASVLVPTVVALIRRANELGNALHDRGY